MRFHTAQGAGAHFCKPFLRGKFVTEKETPIFVYGTLMRGERNSHFLHNSIFVGEDETAPHWDLVNLYGRPGMTPGNRSVKGEVYLVDQDTKDRIDRLERHPFLYQRTSISLITGKIVEAYKICRLFSYFKIIKSGSWRQKEDT